MYASLPSFRDKMELILEDEFQIQGKSCSPLFKSWP
jgi:hypothetical protein